MTANKAVSAIIARMFSRLRVLSKVIFFSTMTNVKSTLHAPAPRQRLYHQFMQHHQE
jgi:hypothetical protein